MLNCTQTLCADGAYWKMGWTECAEKEIESVWRSRKDKNLINTLRESCETRMINWYPWPEVSVSGSVCVCTDISVHAHWLYLGESSNKRCNNSDSCSTSVWFCLLLPAQYGFCTVEWTAAANTVSSILTIINDQQLSYNKLVTPSPIGHNIQACGLLQSLTPLQWPEPQMVCEHVVMVRWVIL